MNYEWSRSIAFYVWETMTNINKQCQQKKSGLKLLKIIISLKILGPYGINNATYASVANAYIIEM